MLAKALVNAFQVNNDDVDIETKTLILNKAEYTATLVACGWAGAIFEVTGPFGQER